MIRWKITAEYKNEKEHGYKKYVWYITSVEDKSILWKTIKKKLYKCSWWKAIKEVILTTKFIRWDKNLQNPCFKYGRDCL